MDDIVGTPDWSRIPPPVDDGAVRHLGGARLPRVPLQATDGGTVDLSVCRGRTVVYIYPRTGRPGVPNPDGWDMIPGARGCSPQSCTFRDHFAELKRLGVDRLYGLSTQDTAYQREAADRLHLPFPLLSDERLEFARALRVPTFEVDGMTLLKRCTLVADEGRVTHVFYPVFPPDRNADQVIAWLRDRSRIGPATSSPRRGDDPTP
jgi:peroxiredoxin